VVSCSAGYGHTAALTSDNRLFTWGFNVYGQLGQGLEDTKTRWFPEEVRFKIQSSNEGEEYQYGQLDRIVKVKCSYYATFAIDEHGTPYAWGKGYLGFKGKSIDTIPRRI
jgi:alpha-tubulin suppressor-like RCC1 family protein